MQSKNAARIKELEGQVDALTNLLVDAREEGFAMQRRIRVFESREEAERGRKYADALSKIQTIESRPADPRLAALRKELEQVKLAFALTLKGDVGDTYTPQQVEKAKKRLAKNNLRLSYDDTTGQVHVLFPAPPEKPPWGAVNRPAGLDPDGTVPTRFTGFYPYTYGGYTY